METKKVLVAEDEPTIREFIVINLKRVGYEPIEASNGVEAMEKYEEYNGDFGVALLDIMMPLMDGLEVCKKLRSMNDKIGILMLSAKTQEMDRVSGLLMGADDYVTKPFSPSELMARVDALYRRAMRSTSSQTEPKSSNDEIVSGEFVLDMRSRTLTQKGIYVELTQIEFQIIELFFKNQGAAMSRTKILEKVWGKDYYGEEKIVDVNIRRIRKKIELDPSNPKHILTIWGMGYKWIA